MCMIESFYGSFCGLWYLSFDERLKWYSIDDRLLVPLQIFSLPIIKMLYVDFLKQFDCNRLKPVTVKMPNISEYSKYASFAPEAKL